MLRFLVIVFAWSCSSGEGTTAPPQAPVASVSLTPASQTVAVGSTQLFVATLKDAQGSTLTGRTVTWSSSTSSIASISADGIATGLTPGQVTITAQSEGKSGSASLTVTSVATAVAINAGNNQAAPSGGRVPVAPSVRVMNAAGVGVRGVTVTFAVASGGGALSGAVQVSDSSGVATVGDWTLGTVAGSNTLTAVVAGLSGMLVTFSAISIDVSATNVPVTFCGDLPVWFAYQSDGGVWTSLAPESGGTYNVPLATRGGIAWVEDSLGAFRTFVRYESRAELASEPCFRTLERPVKRVWGTYTGIGVGQTGALSMATASLRGLQGDGLSLRVRPYPQFEVLVPDRPVDLIAAKYDAEGIPFRASVHRILALADGGKVPPYNFQGVSPGPDTASVEFQRSEGLTPSAYTIFGIGTANWLYTNDFYTPRSEFKGLTSGGGAGSGTVNLTLLAMPAIEVRAEDAYTLTFTATSGTSDRGFIHDLPPNFPLVTTRQATLGPALNSPVVTTIATTPNVRLRAQIASQSTYSASMSLRASGTTSGNEVEVIITAGYSGTLSGGWDVSVPDLTVAGFNSAWGIPPGDQTTWIVHGSSERRMKGRNTTPALFARVRQR